MKKRFIAFGCSYTSFCYPTWADYIGVGFDEYYNFAVPGSSNTWLMNRFIEADNELKYNSETDLIIVMLTGLGRFSYIDPKSKKWTSHGDLHSYVGHTKDPVMKLFIEYFWTDKMAIYQSWIAVKTIKSILMAKNIPHKIIMGIDNCLYLNDKINLSHIEMNYTREIYDLLDIPISLDEYVANLTREEIIWKDCNQREGHPSLREHYKFVEEMLPDFISEESKELLDTWKREFIDLSQQLQGKKFNDQFRKNLSNNVRLFQ